MPSAGSGRSCIIARRERSRSCEACNGRVGVTERLEEGDGRGHLFRLVSKYSRLVPGDRLARKKTRLRNKSATGRVTAIRHLKNQRPIA